MFLQELGPLRVRAARRGPVLLLASRFCFCFRIRIRVILRAASAKRRAPPQERMRHSAMQLRSPLPHQATCSMAQHPTHGPNGCNEDRMNDCTRDRTALQGSGESLACEG